MKSITKLLMMAVVAAGIFTFSSCTPEETDLCKDVTCENDGICVDGTCDCAAGYEGENCEIEMRTKFIASYDVSETKNGGTAYTYSGSIATSSVSAAQVNISNTANGFFNTTVKATIDGTSITIANQQPDGDNYFIQGSGSISNNVITLTYTITGPNGIGQVVTDNYSSTWTKQ